MSKEYPNFYETIKEAQMRLQYTTVLYDGEPYNILCVTGDDQPDNIFRVYMEPIGHPKGSVVDRIPGIPYDMGGHPEQGKMMNLWLAKNPDSGVVRKMINSPLFNKFRPFLLGMANNEGQTFYLERQPQRQTQQGLTQQMIYQSPVRLDSSPGSKDRGGVPMNSPSFKDCIMGVYPTFSECLTNLGDPEIMNDAVAFHRYFALVRGPINTFFVAYKSDIIGFLPRPDASEVRIARQFAHTKEVVEGLGLFNNIEIR